MTKQKTQDVKPMWQSRTVWAMGAIIAASQTPWFKQFVPEDIAVPLTGVAAIVMRLITNKPVGIKI